jgi:hypothetical protein
MGLCWLRRWLAVLLRLLGLLLVVLLRWWLLVHLLHWHAVDMAHATHLRERWQRHRGMHLAREVH